MAPISLSTVANLAEPTAVSVIGWTVATLAAFLACFAVACALERSTRRRRQLAPLPITVSVLAGTLLGALRGSGIVGAGAALGLTDTGQGSTVGRVIFGAVLGTIAVPGLVLIWAALAHHRMEHRLLVAETFAGLLAPGLSADRDNASGRDVTVGGTVSAAQERPPERMPQSCSASCATHSRTSNRRPPLNCSPQPWRIAYGH